MAVTGELIYLQSVKISSIDDTDIHTVQDAKGHIDIILSIRTNGALFLKRDSCVKLNEEWTLFFYIYIIVICYIYFI